MRFGNGGVIVVRGVSDDADVVIAADVNTMADEKPPKPKVDRRSATSEARLDRRQAARASARHVAAGGATLLHVRDRRARVSPSR